MTPQEKHPRHRPLRYPATYRDSFAVVCWRPAVGLLVFLRAALVLLRCFGLLILLPLLCWWCGDCGSLAWLLSLWWLVFLGFPCFPLLVCFSAASRCSPVTFSSPAGILLPFPLPLPSLLRVYCSGFWFYVLLLVCVLVTGVWLLILLHACAAYYVFPCCALSL